MFNLLAAASESSPAIPITVSDSLTLSGFGILVVFLVLTVLAVMIYALGKIFKAKNRKKESLVEMPVIASKPREPLKLIGVDDKTAALIMAIVAEQSGLPLENLDFKSIKMMED